MKKRERKERIGVVVGDQMKKTIVVEVGRRSLNKVFKKYRKEVSSFKVHDEKGECKTGDQVLIVETKPLSKEKRWRVQKILVRGEAIEAKL